MKASIVFDTMPSFRIEGKETGRVRQIDFDLSETHGTIAIDKIHVSERSRTYIPGGLPGAKVMLAPWEEDQPVTPDHPRIVKIHGPFDPKPEDVIHPRDVRNAPR